MKFRRRYRRRERLIVCDRHHPDVPSDIVLMGHVRRKDGVEYERRECRVCRKVRGKRQRVRRRERRREELRRVQVQAACVIDLPQEPLRLSGWEPVRPLDLPPYGARRGVVRLTWTPPERLVVCI